MCTPKRFSISNTPYDRALFSALDELIVQLNIILANAGNISNNATVHINTAR